MDKTTTPTWELTPDHEFYPPMLNDLEHPPSVLYGRGNAEVLHEMCLAVIGARKATPYGLTIASMAGRIAAESGIVLVSGGAMGCDAAAARGALDAGGRSVVVSGVGADLVYPKSSADVFERSIGNGGAVISLVPWGTTVRPAYFPQRNVIIAALARAVLVAEAGQRSGTTSTALAAGDLGREIYAAPGSIFSPESQGANNLIRDGAHIIASEVDLEMLISRDYGVLRLIQEEQTTPRSRMLSALIANPMRPDDLANYLGMEPIEVVHILTDHEIAGVVMRLPDGRYAPTQESYQGRGRM